MTEDKANELTSLPNIGKVVAERLKEVGIETADELKAVGSENAFLRLQAVDEGACINELLGLEGAIQGIRWHNLEETRKAELKMFHKQAKKQITKNKQATK